MKKLIWVSLLLVASLSYNKAHASIVGDLWNDVNDNTHLAIAESATPSYFYNIAKGRSEVGITTSILEYRFISGDVGYSTGYEDKSRGTVLLGGSVHLDRLAAQLFPKVAALASSGVGIVAPTGIANAWEKLYIGFFVGRDTTEQDLNYGIQSGFQFHW